MFSVERDKQQDRLVQQLYKLSGKMLNEDEVGSVIFELNDIYSTNFRHNYSEFFPLILKMNKEDKKYNLDYLTANLETLKAFVEENVESNGALSHMYRNFDKLCDHLNLEIGRVLYYSQKEKELFALDKKIETLAKQVKQSTTDLEKATDTALAVQNKAESIQTELVSVLSIFAAIVITFSGSLTIIGSVITAAACTFVLKLVFILLVCSFCLFNTIVVMLYLVGKIIGKKLLSECKTNCSACAIQKHKCTGLRKIKMKMPYVFYFNLFTALFLIVDIIAWIIYRAV